MVTQKIKELEATKAKIAALEKSIASELHQELSSLPSKYGFDSVESFVAAVHAAGGAPRRGRRKGRGRPAAAAAPSAKVKAPKASKAGGKRRKRAVITDETRSEVKRHVEAGKTGEQIAEALSISLPSVQNIKKALGLVKARKK